MIRSAIDFVRSVVLVVYARLMFPSLEPWGLDKSERVAKTLVWIAGGRWPQRWEGTRPVWHAWHYGRSFFYLPYHVYVDRILEIVDVKPRRELVTRLRLMYPVERPDWMRPSTDAYGSPLTDADGFLHRLECGCTEWKPWEQDYYHDMSRGALQLPE